VIAAGGTGGHTFPATALASVLIARGRKAVFMTDSRGGAFTEKVPGSSVVMVRAAQLGGKNPAAYVTGGIEILRGIFEARAHLKRLKPAAVVGFGGFSSLPQMMAATQLGCKTAVHEQNAVLGRVNRFVASKAGLIATSFPEVSMMPARRRGVVRLVGNPVRPAILAAAAPYMPPEGGGPFDLVVFGGSQGARVMSDVVPTAIASLDAGLRARLRVTQQAREEDVARTDAVYRSCGVDAVVTPFIRDMPERLARAHLVIARSGASTFAEIAVMARPSILVPLPIATDDHQFHNAQSLAAAGAAEVLRQEAFTTDAVAGLVTRWAGKPELLAGMSAAARTLARPRAAEDLADAVEALAEGRLP
jgi:UDP-N-acetylglucosamine--N-acetylmuramyl-(pentapeptide) pyrophosphoryl-undecaprenol N-acetylglucosamine transferase